MPTSTPFDLVIGLDRSNRKADLYSITTVSGDTNRQTIGTAPEALHTWLRQLRQQHPQARIALCLEQPAASLRELKVRCWRKCGRWGKRSTLNAQVSTV